MAHPRQVARGCAVPPAHRPVSPWRVHWGFCRKRCRLTRRSNLLWRPRPIRRSSGGIHTVQRLRRNIPNSALLTAKSHCNRKPQRLSKPQRLNWLILLAAYRSRWGSTTSGSAKMIASGKHAGAQASTARRPRIVSRTARRISRTVACVGFHSNFGIGMALFRVTGLLPGAPFGERSA